MTMPTQAELRKLFWLHEDTGTLYWRNAPSNNMLPWRQAGTSWGGRSRIQVTLRERYLMAHNIVWTYMNGSIPPGMFVDHIDRNEGNNRPSNLRLTTRSANCQNRVYKSAGNTHVGVYPHGNGWVAKIKLPGQKRKHLGFFLDKDDAIAARRAAAEAAGQLHLTDKT